jgi:hypothetical protein
MHRERRLPLNPCKDSILQFETLTLTMRAVPLLASIRTRRLGFLNAANDPFSRATREWLLGIQPDVLDIVLHAFSHDNIHSLKVRDEPGRPAPDPGSSSQR